MDAPAAPAEGSPPQQEDVPLPGTGGLVVPAVPGRLAEAYDVQKPVGKGGYAVVYKAVRREDGRVVAVKKVEVGFDGAAGVAAELGCHLGCWVASTHQRPRLADL